MKLSQITEPDPNTQAFLQKLTAFDWTSLPFSEQKIQGEQIWRNDELTVIRSPRRFKLESDGRDTLYFFTGAGHFKWARGERDFHAGETFCIEQAGEYEVNGNCVFARRSERME